MDIIAFTRAIVDIDSTTGREQEVAAFIARTLREFGWHVDEQPLSDGRFNVLARIEQPTVVLSTHFDCVPPFFPSRIEGSRLYGRGACDAKGILAAQVAAAERLGAPTWGCCLSPGKSAGATGPKPRTAGRTPPHG
ncbi:MAG: M20/M25/M40 family metallo-hydrolase [Acidobacteria bacterium]|nr:M20/M25/M40 family metallo-hydrolase [Acidobacteriota bacterium]